VRLPGAGISCTLGESAGTALKYKPAGPRGNAGRGEGLKLGPEAIACQQFKSIHT
jgi:hypothetical protein